MFIVLEGGEGAGKSTLAADLAARLRAAGRTVNLTREPGGTAAGELVRGLLHEPLQPWAETFAFMVARAELVAEVIRPALERGETVLCDRFAGSTFAYQGWGRGLALADLDRVNALATGGLAPDLVLYLDIPPEIGLARKHGETEAIRTGLEARAFHERVREGYRAQAAAAPATWVTIDALQPAAVVAELAWSAVAARLG
ncbi:MAG: dTMP kinase [Dehalococcoidia bacterium]|nr:dTMP kinase [Dehalococcoidia bacterium]